MNTTVAERTLPAREWVERVEEYLLKHSDDPFPTRRSRMLCRSLNELREAGVEIIPLPDPETNSNLRWSLNLLKQSVNRAWGRDRNVDVIIKRVHSFCAVIDEALKGIEKKAGRSEA